MAPERDGLPTPAMCRAAVEYLNGADVYQKVPKAALDIEEAIYREVWLAMRAAAPQNPMKSALIAIRDHWHEFGPGDGFEEVLEAVCGTALADRPPR